MTKHPLTKLQREGIEQIIKDVQKCSADITKYWTGRIGGDLTGNPEHQLSVIEHQLKKLLTYDSEGV